MKYRFLLLFTFIIWNATSLAQNTEADDLGAWYMYFFNGKIKNEWGIQGDVQYRNFNLGGDLEQLLIRGGVHYTPKKSDVRFTLGLVNVTTGTLGEIVNTFNENRVYQEVLIPQKTGRFHLNHRFRYEQRFVEDQNFRTRFRYNLLINIPLNNTTILPKTWYLAFYNEVFINGERKIDNERTVPIFDRNRLYSGIGYSFNNSLRTQIGFMNQSLENIGKNQLQISLHHNF